MVNVDNNSLTLNVFTLLNLTVEIALEVAFCVLLHLLNEVLLNRTLK